jgi:hypothetical protein
MGGKSGTDVDRKERERERERRQTNMSRRERRWTQLQEDPREGKLAGGPLERVKKGWERRLKVGQNEPETRQSAESLQNAGNQLGGESF